jgi:hypothetical protein
MPPKGIDRVSMRHVKARSTEVQSGPQTSRRVATAN